MPRRKPISEAEWLNSLAADITVPIPSTGVARFMAGLFNLLGVITMVLGVLVFVAGLTVSPSNGPSINDLSYAQFSIILANYLRVVFLVFGPIIFFGGASYVLIGSTVNMIAGIREEMAYSHRLLAAILTTNLRSQSYTQQPPPTQPMPYPQPYTQSQPRPR